MFYLWLFLAGTDPGSSIENQNYAPPRIVGAYTSLNECLQARATWNLTEGFRLKCLEKVK